MEKKTYRCVSRTKRSFETALTTLAKQTPLAKITVKALCDEAQMSRNAFYFHYADIDSLVEELEQNLLLEITDLLAECRRIGFPDNVIATIRKLPDIFIKHKDVTTMLLDSSYSNSFLERTNTLFSDFFFQYFKDYHRTTFRVGYDYFYTFLSTGFFGMLNRYLHDPQAFDRERFTALAYTLIKRLMVLGEPNLDYLRSMYNQP